MRVNFRVVIVPLVFDSLLALMLGGCAGASPALQNTPGGSIAPNPSGPIGSGPNTSASQGVAIEGNQIAYVSANNWLAGYNFDWSLRWRNMNELTGLPSVVNHIGDVDFYNGKLIAAVQYYSSCTNYASPVLAVYDASNGSLLTWSDISADGHEVSSVTVVSEKNQVVVSSFCGAYNGDTTLWIYDLNALLNSAPGNVLRATGTIHLSTSVQTIQGISSNSTLGQYLVSTDLGGPGGTLWYIAGDGTVSGPAYVVPEAGELEGVDFTTGNIYYLINGYVYYIGPPKAAPTFSVASGTYTSAQSVTISDSDSDAVIHYTTDGSMPKASSPVYSAPISVTRTLTLKAIATATGSANSPMVVSTYTIN